LNQLIGPTIQKWGNGRKPTFSDRADEEVTRVRKEMNHALAESRSDDAERQLGLSCRREQQSLNRMSDCSQKKRII
jgi:hypothetical protein